MGREAVTITLRDKASVESFDTSDTEFSTLTSTQATTIVLLAASYFRGYTLSGSEYSLFREAMLGQFNIALPSPYHLKRTICPAHGKATTWANALRCVGLTPSYVAKRVANPSSRQQTAQEVLVEIARQTKETGSAPSCRVYEANRPKTAPHYSYGRRIFGSWPVAVQKATA
jgi:hypothetical protein